MLRRWAVLILFLTLGFTAGIVVRGRDCSRRSTPTRQRPRSVDEPRPPGTRTRSLPRGGEPRSPARCPTSRGSPRAPLLPSSTSPPCRSFAAALTVLPRSVLPPFFGDDEFMTARARRQRRLRRHRLLRRLCADQQPRGRRAAGRGSERILSDKRERKAKLIGMDPSPTWRCSRSTGAASRRLAGATPAH